MFVGGMLVFDIIVLGLLAVLSLMVTVEEYWCLMVFVEEFRCLLGNVSV